MIEINNLTTIRIDKGFLKKIARRVFEKEGIKKQIELSIALIGQKEIRKINKKYLKKNRATDILAFPEIKSSWRKIQTVRAERKQSLGEIIICPEEIKKNAKRFNVSFKKELARVLIHGTLHLLGHNHEKSKEKARKMEERQNYYLSLIKK